jgi:transposase InsO family protein
VKIAAFHKESRGNYGSPRILEDLVADGERVSRKRVARLMRAQGLQGSRPRPFRATTDSDHDDPVANDLVARDFAPDGPDRVWAADITYVRTWEGWLYLAVVIDLWSRRVVGWAVADHMRTELVLKALDMAVGQRSARGVTFHSDRGSQYTSGRFQTALTTRGMVSSMSRKGNCWDNAVAESFFSSLKTELIYRQPWPSASRARLAIHDYITGFYNYRRRHSFLGGVSPMAYEESSEAEQEKAA